MARTAEVTKVGVTSAQKGLTQITLRLTYKDGATVLVISDFTQSHSAGEAPSVVVDKFKEEMQQKIDFFKEAEAISNHAQMATAITNLQNSLGV